MHELVAIFILFSLGMLCYPIARKWSENWAEVFFHSSMLTYSLLIYLAWALSELIGFSNLSILMSLVVIIILNIPYFSAANSMKSEKSHKIALALPIGIMLILLAHRSVNANQGVDWQDLTIVGSILNHSQIPPVNNWLSGTTTVYQYGYHLFTAAVCAMTGISKSVAPNIIIPYMAFMTLLGVYVLTHKLSKRRLAGFFAQVLSVSGSLVGLLLLAYLMNNPLPSDEGMWTLGKIPIPFNLPDRVTSYATVEGGMLDTGTLLPSPATYFLGGTSFAFAFAFFIFATYLLLDAHKHGIKVAMASISLMTTLLVYPFVFILLSASLMLYTLYGVYSRRESAILHILLICLTFILAIPRLMELPSTTWIPYLDTYSLGILALFYGTTAIFFLIGLLHLIKSRQHMKEGYAIVLTIILTGFILVSTIFPLQQGTADRKHLVTTWFLVAVIGGIGIDYLLRNFNWRIIWGIIPLLLVGMLSPAMMLAYNSAPTEYEILEKPSIGDFPAGMPQIQADEFTFDGLEWIRIYYPEEYEALMWVRENTNKDAVFVEAYEEKYKFKPLIPSVADRQVILGWYGLLEQQGYDTAERQEMIDAVYNANHIMGMSLGAYSMAGHDPTAGDIMLLSKSDADYIWVGETERARYNFTAHTGDLVKVFENEEVTIYAIS